MLVYNVYKKQAEIVEVFKTKRAYKKWLRNSFVKV